MILQSWDTANKPGELSDFSVCTTWGTTKALLSSGRIAQTHRLSRIETGCVGTVHRFSAQVILIEDKASGTQLIQEIVQEGVYAARPYEPTMDKIMRIHSVTSTIENGFVHLPENAEWLAVYLHELVTFPKSKHDDQADSTSQALDWAKQRDFGHTAAIYNALTGECLT